MDDPNFNLHHRLAQWANINESDIQLFLGHVIVMGLVRKPTIAKYWRRNGLSHTPFFGRYMTRLQFEKILSNLHLNDNTTTNRDPLYKVRPLINMIDRNCLHVYTPKQNMSVDEASCPFKGRLGFKMYNPRKPARFHIRLYQVCESESGYCTGLEIFTGNKNSRCIKKSKPIDPGCTVTTKLVLGLLQKCNLLDRGYHVYMDNYYTSVELMEEMYLRSTFGAGTCRSNRKGLPKALTEVKLKTGEMCFRRSDTMLALKWFDKRAVLMLSTIHDAVEITTGKKDRHGNPITKPECIHQYTINMRGCDLSDQLMTSYSLLRRSLKWWRKLFFHLFSLCINNAYILYKKFTTDPVPHDTFMEMLANTLILSSVQSRTLAVTRPRAPSVVNDTNRLDSRHFPSYIGKNATKNGSKMCAICNFGKKTIIAKGYKGTTLSRKLTSYMCKPCNIPLCIVPCFELYHTKEHYQNYTFQNRLTKL